MSRAGRGGALAVLALTGAGCRLSQSATDRALQRMNEQPRYDVYEAGRFFRNGMTMQVPPAGTVARDAVTDPAIATGRSPSGAYLTTSPVPVTPRLLELGRSRFHIYCAVCHGTGGFGGSVVAANMVDRRPPSLRGPGISALPPGFLFEVISRGLGRMPSYSSELPVTQRWAVVAYLQKLQQAGERSPAEQADSLRAAALRAEDSLRQISGDSVK
jgi:mono/diheme cytochrome c family protein